MTNATLEERFWAQVDKRGPDECWPWTGKYVEKGYGYMVTPWSRRGEGAHRVSMRLHGFIIPPGMHVLHHCDNPPCCNPGPGHLFIGTHVQNMRDKWLKGRVPTGERNAGSKLTDAQFSELLGRRAAGESCVSLGAAFGIDESTVRKRIARHRRRLEAQAAGVAA